MAGTTKKALKGFSRVKLFPVIENTAEDYTVDTSFDLPEAQSMTQDVNTTTETIYADDVIYLENKDWLGINTTITLAEISLELMARLGLGTYDPVEKTLDWNPQGENKEYGMTFRALLANGTYRMFRRYSFVVNEVRESGLNTKGAGSGIGTYQVIGVFTGRKKDAKPGQIHDSDDGIDMTWLDSIV